MPSAPLADSPAIHLDHLTVTRGTVAVLKDLTATIQPGQVTAIIGPNGAGKTTLLLAILGLIPFAGTIRFADETGRTIIPRVAYVPQSLSFDRQSLVTVLEFMALGLQTRPIWLGISSQTRSACLEHLKRIEVEHLLDKPLGRLSGGELQRVLLAKALLRQPNLLLLDEPVSGVDIAGGHLFCDVLERLRTDGRMTLVMVSHDLSVVSRHATRVLCINQSLSCEGEAPVILNSDNLMKIYGIHSGLYEHHPVNSRSECHLSNHAPQSHSHGQGHDHSHDHGCQGHDHASPPAEKP